MYILPKKSINIKRRMTIVIVILDDAGHRPHSHLVETHPFFCIHPVAKSLTKDVEALETPVKCLLAILDACHKFFELRRMLILCHSNFIWLTNVATISNAFFSLFELEVESMLVPIFLVFAGISTTKNGDIMY